MSNWYGMYEDHSPDIKECPAGMLEMGEANTDEDHDVMHECDKSFEHEGAHRCFCGMEF